MRSHANLVVAEPVVAIQGGRQQDTSLRPKLTETKQLSVAGHVQHHQQPAILEFSPKKEQRPSMSDVSLTSLYEGRLRIPKCDQATIESEERSGILVL